MPMSATPELIVSMASLMIETGETNWSDSALDALLCINWPILFTAVILVGWGLVDMLLPDDIYKNK